MAPVLRHCPCLRPESDDVRLLEYSHSNLDDVPNEVFGYERTLEELFLDANQIKDLPRPLFHCHGLRKLNLSDNEVQTLPPAIASLVNLEHLDISKNGILEIPESIKGCKCLTVIDASVNPLGKLPEGFTFLINLHELYLNDTFLEYLPANFGRLAHLRILELRENHLKLLPKSMARLVELSRLDIGQNDFSELPEVIGNLPRLVELWCDCNNLNCLPPFLGGLKKLAYLDASKNKIYEVAEEIEGCISLCDLTLSSNRIKVLPEGIANLRRLTVLRVDENRMVSVPENIGNLCNLEELVLSSNNLKTLPPSLGLLRNLRTLIADDNLLEELPCEIGSCLKLTILSLRDNKLIQIPDELGHVTALKVINLSGNLLQYLPFSIAKLPNLQALWLSENQNKPLIPLQSDTDRVTGQKVLTCFMLPQVPLEEEVQEIDRSEAEVPDSGRGRHIIKFAFDAEKDQPSKLVRAPTPYPKELKAHARHARNYALKKQGSKDSEGNEASENPQTVDAAEGLHATGATPDIMILPTLPPKEANAKVKEAAVIKPKSPLSSPPKHERHYIPNIKDQACQDGEIKQHSFLEQNPLQLSHQVSSEIIGSEMVEKVLGRRDSRGDGSSSENTSTSATGSPKLTPDSILMDSCNHPLKMDKDGLFKKNVPVPGKRDTWMRQRLLKQGSGDSDRGYRSDHEVYMAEKDQYGQCYHDGYASDWEAFLAKQNYNGPNGTDPIQGAQHYVRSLHSQGDLDYRGHAEGQEIKPDGERDGFVIPWDSRFHYPNESGAVLVDDEYQARMTPPYNNYWQMDPNSGQFYSIYDMSHSYPPAADNVSYVYSRSQGAEVPPVPPQPYYEDCDGYKRIAPPFWLQHPPPNPAPVICNNPGTIPRRLGAASPRLKRSQCLSVQAPLHGTPQEYHLIPHQPGNIRPVLPNSSPRPGRSPSPGIENRMSVQYSSQPYQKFPSHYQPPYPVQGYPITTQPVNSSQFPPPQSNVHAQYHGNYQNPPPVYPTLPPSPRMKHVAHPYGTSAVDDSALVSRPYPMVPVANVHKSTYYSSNAQGGNMDALYHHRIHSSANPEEFEKVQDAEYGVVSPGGSLHYRSGSIPAQIQSIDACDVTDIQHLNRSVPSINIIPSTSPPRTSYVANVDSWKGDSSNMASIKSTSETSTSVHADATEPKIPSSPNQTIDLDSDKVDEKNSMNKNKNLNSVEEPYLDCAITNASTKINKLKSDERVNDVCSQDPNSYTVISPKPNKIVPQSNIVNSPNPNKDIKLGASLSDGQTSFRRPGCFQAVPMNIPSVHSAPRKIEPVAKENYEMKKDVTLSNPSEHPVLVSNAQNSKESIPIESENNQARSTNLPNPEHNSDTKKSSGYIGGIIKSLNKSLNSQNKESELDQKSSKKNYDQSILDKSKNDNGESEKHPVKPATKPGYPVQVLSNNDMQSGKATDRPPDLPKKDRNAVTMRNIIPPSENKFNPIPSQFVNQNFPPEIHKSYSDKVQKIPERQKRSANDSLPEPPKSSNPQNKIIVENNKNSKITQHSSKEHVPNNQGKISQHKVDNKNYSSQNQSESSKVSSDKRFQKVLPPIDTTFHLKPCNARKSPSNFDQPAEEKVNLINEKQSEGNNKETTSVSKPSLPAKTSISNKSDSNEPPIIPPKRSSMGLNMGLGDLPPKTMKHENNPERNVSGRQLERTKSLGENEHINDVNESNKISKLHVDIVQAKDVNNEKNEQLQKGNMPDLLSRIVTDEKNELIILEQPNKILKSVKSEEDELSKDNFSFNKESDKDNAPDSPKSPKRQSWFFGSHKNSLVFPVILSRNPELGFSIEGGVGSPRNPGKPYDSGIYVAHVLDDGPANNLLKPGDKILQVDGKDFTQLDHNKAVALLQESGATVSLMVSRQ
ncbi:leucine-rich repeat-containing protein 7 [Trichonephila inaurata madagascariensis]|uniref:Leucine-rich repeat-containing protein 7 n=1 Tax=Trichonephila inaurata madagascariensis TaxID=2747483 RepID=A0A8X6YPC0_9ARAC|nr:leucine-rich repeat-containing protein 7 [Trichonephila inaurata madagascariensis]